MLAIAGRGNDRGMIVTTFASGRLAPCFPLTEPLWAAWCKSHGFEWRPGEASHIGRWAQWYKMQHVLDLLRHGEAVLWVDADSFPRPRSPSPLNEEECQGEVLGIPINNPCPHAVEMMAGLFWVTVDAAPMLEDAINRPKQGIRGWPEQRSMAEACGLRQRGMRFEPPASWRKLRYPVKPLSMRWVTPIGHGIHGAPAQKKDAATVRRDALVWHAIGSASFKPALIRQAITLGLHANPEHPPEFP